MSSGPSASSSGELQVLLHPLVIVNITDHATRFRIQEDRPTRVFGALFGTQEGRKLEIHTSFEMILKPDPSSPSGFTIDKDYLEIKQESYAQVFSNYEVLGWYSNVAGLMEKDDFLHGEFLQVNENSIYLMVDTSEDATRENGQPIKIVEAVATSENASGIKFRDVGYSLEIEESERIALDHVTRFARSASKQNSSVSAHLSTQFSAASLLLKRLKSIVDFLESVTKGEVKPSHKTLRHIARVWYMLPKKRAHEDFLEGFSQQASDALLVTYLSSLTKGLTELSQLVESFQISASLGGGGRRHQSREQYM